MKSILITYDQAHEEGIIEILNRHATIKIERR